MQDHRQQREVSTFIVIAIVVMFVLAMCAGCSTVVPVTAKFPAPPDKAGNAAMTACPQLKELQQDAKLSDVARTVNVNYGTYYECAVKVDTWIEWYHSQKKIFEGAGK